MSVELTVTLHPTEVSLAPSETAQIVVTIDNASDVFQHYGVDLIGLSPEWYTVEPEVTKLRPNQTGTVTVTVTMPAAGGNPAGSYNIGVLVRSPSDDAVSRSEELLLEIKAAPALTATVTPQVVTGGSDAQYVVELKNSGNVELEVVLSGADAEQKMRCRFEPPRVPLEPGASARSRLRAHRAAPWAGAKASRDITVKADGVRATAEAKVTFVQNPRIAPAVFKILTRVTGIATLAGAVVVGAVVLRDALGADESTEPTDGPTNSESITSSNTPTTDPTDTDTTGTSPSPAEPAVLDFSTIGNGLAGAVTVKSDTYRDQGIDTLSGVPDAHAPADCTEAFSASLVTDIGQDLLSGTFLTGSRSDNPDGCPNVAVSARFSEPATTVTVDFYGQIDHEYALRVVFADGTPFVTQTASATPVEGALLGEGTVTYADTDGHGIAQIVFGGVVKGEGDIVGTFIKRLTFE